MVHSKEDVEKFVKLLEDKKLKQAKTYIKKIEDEDNAAQNIVAQSLEQCLVSKKTTPMGLTAALFIYKQLLVRSLFDYTESEIFNENIHQFVYQTCLYNKTATLQERGKNYFKEKLAAPQNEQNQNLGCTIVTLSLQIVQMMAKWYPTDFLTQSQSRYLLYEQQLKNKKVTFSDPKENVYLKPQDKANFDLLNKKWMKKMDEIYNQELSDTPQGPAKELPVIVPPLKTNSPSKLQKTQQKQSKKQTQKDQLVQITGQIKSAIKIQDKTDRKNLNSEKPKVPEPTVIQKIANPTFKLDQQNKVRQSETRKNELKTQQVSSKGGQKSKAPIESNKTQMVEKEKSKPIKNEEQLQNQTNYNKQLIGKPKEGLQKIAETGKQQLPKKGQEGSKQISKYKNQTSQLKPQSRPQSKSQYADQSAVVTVRTDQLNELQDKSPSQSLLSSRIQKVTEEPFHPPPYSQSPSLKYSKEEIKKNAIRQENDKYKQADELIRKNKLSQSPQYNKSPPARNQQPISNNQDYPKAARKTQQNFYTKNISPNTPKKIDKQQNNRKLFKTQKPQQNILQDHKLAKRSMPKTERKFNQFCNPIYGIKFSNLSPHQKGLILSGKQEQTLSDFRQLKNKKKTLGLAGGYNTIEPLLLLMKHTKLGERLIPFLPQYYQPVDLGMRALILQSLKVGCSSTFEPSKPFYKNANISIRLLKSSNSYLISFNNIGVSTLIISYSQALQAKYGDQFSHQIKVRGIERNKPDEIYTWKVDPNHFVDIPFQFYTANPNFKFLQFTISINNQVLQLSLPITLLDQGTISSYIDVEEVAQFIGLHGRLLKSPSIKIQGNQGQLELPLFFGRQKNAEIIGQMSYSIETQPNRIAKVAILLRKIGESPLKCEIVALYDSRDEANQDYAKVLLELLCFLMHKQA